MTSLLKTMAKFGPLRNQTNYIQGGHKPGKLKEFEKLSKSQGKLREI